MKLHILGSSSSGNCYILKGKSEQLLIEAGVKLIEVKKALSFRIDQIAGCLVSHIHQDHSKYSIEYAFAGIPIFDVFTDRKDIRIGGFRVRPFEVVHDVTCFGFIIHHQEMGNMVFMTDTEYSPYRFEKISHFCIEANYDQHILDENVMAGRIPLVARNRVMKSHMSIQTVKELLKENDLSKTRNIILLHLSNGNSNARDFKDEIEAMTGIPVTIADKGIEVNLSLNVF